MKNSKQNLITEKEELKTNMESEIFELENKLVNLNNIND